MVFIVVPRFFLEFPRRCYELDAHKKEYMQFGLLREHIVVIVSCLAGLLRQIPEIHAHQQAYISMPGMDLNAVLRKDHESEIMGKGFVGLGKGLSNLSVTVQQAVPWLGI